MSTKERRIPKSFRIIPELEHLNVTGLARELENYVQDKETASLLSPDAGEELMAVRKKRLQKNIVALLEEALSKYETSKPE